MGKYRPNKGGSICQWTKNCTNDAVLQRYSSVFGWLSICEYCKEKENRRENWKKFGRAK